jgi:hypothetical protein
VGEETAKTAAMEYVERYTAHHLLNANVLHWQDHTMREPGIALPAPLTDRGSCILTGNQHLKNFLWIQ